MPTGPRIDDAPERQQDNVYKAIRYAFRQVSINAIASLTRSTSDNPFIVRTKSLAYTCLHISRMSADNTTKDSNQPSRAGEAASSRSDDATKISSPQSRPAYEDKSSPRSNEASSKCKHKPTWGMKSIEKSKDEPWSVFSMRGQHGGK